jgi:hypothetical protein
VLRINQLATAHRIQLAIRERTVIFERIEDNRRTHVASWPDEGRQGGR